MQAEEVRAEADATVARAHAQASEMVAEAKGEAEQIVTRADAQVVERRAREELTLEELRGQAEQELGAMRADTDAIAEERRRLVEEIRELAARLESVADSGAAGAAQEPGGVDAGAPPASGDRFSWRPDGSCDCTAIVLAAQPHGGKLDAEGRCPKCGLQVLPPHHGSSGTGLWPRRTQAARRLRAKLARRAYQLMGASGSF